jgi:hypothetical protein
MPTYGYSKESRFQTYKNEKTKRRKKEKKKKKKKIGTSGERLERRGRKCISVTKHVGRGKKEKEKGNLRRLERRGGIIPIISNICMIASLHPNH